MRINFFLWPMLITMQLIANEKARIMDHYDARVDWKEQFRMQGRARFLNIIKTVPIAYECYIHNNVSIELNRAFKALFEKEQARYFITKQDLDKCHVISLWRGPISWQATKLPYMPMSTASIFIVLLLRVLQHDDPLHLMTVISVISLIYDISLLVDNRRYGELKKFMQPFYQALRK